MSAIRFENVSKSYDGQIVLQNFSMVVQTAETKVILGGTGSGKSTVLKMVAGLVKPDSGQVLVEDEDITDLTENELQPIRRKIGFVFQEGALFDSLSVKENVAYRLRENGVRNEKEIDEIVREVLGFVGLEDAIAKMPAELSGGMKRRVAIARALVGHPRILLYDEPTAGLDPITSRAICELIIKLRDLERVSSIFVTHDLKSAYTMASEFAVLGPHGEATFVSENDRFCLINTRFLMLKEGKVLFEGPDETLRSVKEEYIQEFLS
ncbi:MAG: ATP-binding cassette domain-containing protein [Acidobacteria bacterium]|nr:ATP-binding cassette domain-containing protein [Acidobacteriota bacterium]